jgi:hypothetical protein
LEKFIAPLFKAGCMLLSGFRANTGYPSMVFCIDWLLAGKYDGGKAAYALTWVNHLVYGFTGVWQGI